MNNRADWITNGCLAQGMQKADGALNGTLSGRVWDSREVGVSLLVSAGPAPLVQCVAQVLGVIIGNLSPTAAAALAAQIGDATVSAHTLMLTSACDCWEFVDKISHARLVDDRDPVVEYTGSWETHSISARVQATDSVSSSIGATVAIRSGSTAYTRVVWIAMKGPSAGDATVSMCGGTEQNVDLRQPTFDARQAYTFNLPAGCDGAVIKISVPSWRFNLARDVNVDAFELWEE